MTKQTCGVDGCEAQATMVDDNGASCDDHVCAVEGCDDHAVGEVDGVPACEEHHMLATADLLDHVATWGDADGWSVDA